MKIQSCWHLQGRAHIGHGHSKKKKKKKILCWVTQLCALVADVSISCVSGPERQNVVSQHLFLWYGIQDLLYLLLSH